MNVTELARRVRIPTQRLKEVLPELGFDIGMRAIKVDDRAAQAIIEKLSHPDVRAHILMPHKTETAQQSDGAAVPPSDAVAIPAKIMVKEYASLLGLPVTKVIVELMKQGVMAAQNQCIDYETAAIIAGDLGRKVERAPAQAPHTSHHEAQEEKLLALLKADGADTLVARPPVVVVMGHVDHGKTTLLDAIRKTNVTAQEHGGITQHVGAYQVTVPPHNEPVSSPGILRQAQDDFATVGRKITFIDTPGHEAFTAMRSRGARVADIAILVVAADDGVQPQTIEALTHIQRAQLPFIVAINKIDKAGANPERIKQDLAHVNVLSEAWGGKTPFIEISAKQGKGITDLLDLVLLLADVERERIRANPKRAALGTIIESHVDTGEGPVATVLVQTGTLRVGDLVQVGDAFGKIKAMKDYQGMLVREAPPSMPTRILGLKSLPQVGDILEVAADAEAFRQKMRDTKPKKRPIRFGAAPTPPTPTTEDEEKEETLKLPEVNLILRADVLGSLEAIHEALETVTHAEVKVAVVQEGVGDVNEGDVLAAEASSALVLGFNVEAAPAAHELAKDKGVILKTFAVIYELIDEVKSAVESLLSPEVRVTTTGMLEILALFRQEKNSAIIGGRVKAGKIKPGHLFHLTRGGKDSGRGKIVSVQISKQAMSEVVEGQECGMKVETRAIPAVGDTLGCYTEERKKREL